MHYKRLAGIPWQLVSDSAVIIDPKNNKIHELDPVGTEIWKQLDGEKNSQEIAEQLAQNYTVEEAMALSDVEDFCEELFSEGLIDKEMP